MCLISTVFLHGLSPLPSTRTRRSIYLLIAIADYADIKDYVLYDGEDDDPDTEIPEDNVKPITLDDDDNEIADTVVEEGAKEDVAPSLLSKIKEDLPSKVEEATEKQENK